MNNLSKFKCILQLWHIRIIPKVRFSKNVKFVFEIQARAQTF